MNMALYPYHPIFVVDDEPDIVTAISRTLKMEGLTNQVCLSDSREVMPQLEQHGASLVLLDITMPHINGMDILQDIKRIYPSIPVVMATAMNSTDTVVHCIRQGADDYIDKPLNANRLITAVRTILELRGIKQESEGLWFRQSISMPKNPGFFRHIITHNHAMLTLFRYIEIIAPTSGVVLVTGETGVGKELISRALHTASGRKGAFVAVNVAGIDDEAFSDTLFGHVKGAFTGAERQRAGQIKAAARGTLFLDEIGDLSPGSQVKLLRLLEERTYQPLGSDTAVKTNARIITATNKNLNTLVEQGKFRQDLLYRLQQVVEIPPLRERLDDLPLLVEHFAALAAQDLGTETPQVTPQIYPHLRNHPFPGNIRELQSIIYGAVSKLVAPHLGVESITTAVGAAVRLRDTQLDIPKVTFGPILPNIKDVRIALVSEALDRADGSITQAAKLIGVSRQSLSQFLKRHNIFHPPAIKVDM